MATLEQYNQCFKDVLDIPEENLAKAEYQAIESWDSVGHMSLVAAIEDAFDIMLDAEDIIDFSSYEKGKEILAKYSIDF